MDCNMPFILMRKYLLLDLNKVYLCTYTMEMYITIGLRSLGFSRSIDHLKVDVKIYSMQQIIISFVLVFAHYLFFTRLKTVCL